MNKVQLIVFFADFVLIFKNLIVYAIIARILASWFTMGQMRSPGKVIRFLDDITNPFINLARKLPHTIGMFDLAPMIAMFGVDFLGQFIATLLYKLI